MPVLRSLIQRLKTFKPLLRKSYISELMGIVGSRSLEDAGFVEVGGRTVVVSCDGILEEVVRAFPRLAGYYSVLVNVQDVVCKGARPLGFLYVLSSSSPRVRREMTEGIREGLGKFGLEFLKAHTHPDTSYDAVDGMCVGLARKVLRSNTARAGEHLLLAADLKGTFRKGELFNALDSVRERSRKEVLRQVEGMVRVAEGGLASASKDVSAPGIVGTAAMLCEYSGVGAVLELDRIPLPERVGMEEWLLTYPSTCYLLTSSRPERCLKTLRAHGLEAERVGEITRERKVVLRLGGKEETFLDLRKESVFGFRRT
ncbi:MAG: AIR synthase-related protein [Candidatus Hadarchaeales archaeon]